MDDETLSNYIPCIGDRLALKEFCQPCKEKESKKETILTKLRKKLAKRGRKASTSSDDDQGSSKKVQMMGNYKKTRQIEIGWICSVEGNSFKHVRTNQGGGTRKISVPKTYKKKEILTAAQNLFFPEGMSVKGALDKFNVELWDYKSNVVNEDLTIQEMYEITGLSKLRFYLSTKEKTETVVSNNCQYYDAVFEAEVNVDQTGNGNENYEYFFPEEPLYLRNFLIPKEAVYLTIHRGHVFLELIEACRSLDKNNSELFIKMLSPTGMEESALDIGGVLRDTFSEFFKTFYEKCTTGAFKKVPCLRHDLKNHWQIIAKIIFIGYKQVDYFPIDISPIFIKHCIGYKEEDDEELLNNFYLVISSSDATILKTALSDYDSVDKDELLDVLESIQCKIQPTKQNIKNTVVEIAHKVLIQEPKFVIDTWNLELQNLMTIEQLHKIYENKEITYKAVYAKIIFKENMLLEENKVSTFLKKFLREADNNTLKNFLRFCTGADVITDNCIIVEFNEDSGFRRAPTSKTCGCVLTLSVCYDDFIDFRSELMNVLSSNMWVMDFV